MLSQSSSDKIFKKSICSLNKQYLCIISTIQYSQEKTCNSAFLICICDKNAKWDSLQAVGDFWTWINPQTGLLCSSQSTWINPHHRLQQKSTHLEKVVMTKVILISPNHPWLVWNFLVWFLMCQGSEDENNGSSFFFFSWFYLSGHATGTAGRLSSEDLACVWHACQGVSNEADGFNSSLQLDCDFTMWRGLRATLITEHDMVRDQECCVLCKRDDRLVNSTQMSIFTLFPVFLLPFLISSVSHNSAVPGVYFFRPSYLLLSVRELIPATVFNVLIYFWSVQRNSYVNYLKCKRICLLVWRAVFTCTFPCTHAKVEFG